MFYADDLLLLCSSQAEEEEEAVTQSVDFLSKNVKGSSFQLGSKQPSSETAFQNSATASSDGGCKATVHIWQPLSTLHQHEACTARHLQYLHITCTCTCTGIAVLVYGVSSR